MISGGGGAGAATTSSRIPVAKHRQASPEHQFPNHNFQFQQSHQPSQQHISRLPKYHSSPQHDSAVSSGGGSSGGGSGESEGEQAVGMKNKRRKDSAGSITGLHGMSGNSILTM